jgi:hypothetical protein
MYALFVCRGTDLDMCQLHTEKILVS